MKGRRIGNHGRDPTNERNIALARLLPTRVVNYNHRVNEIDEACPSWMTQIVHYLSSR